MNVECDVCGEMYNDENDDICPFCGAGEVVEALNQKIRRLKIKGRQPQVSGKVKIIKK